MHPFMKEKVIHEKSQQLKNRWRVKNTNTQSHSMPAMFAGKTERVQDAIASPRASGDTLTLLP